MKINFLLLFSIIFMLQSCSIYKKKVLTLDDATKVNTEVMIKRINGQEIELSKIEKVDSTYYGIKKVKKETIKIPLNNLDIKSIKAKDKNASRLLSSGIGIIVLSIFMDFFHFDLLIR